MQMKLTATSKFGRKRATLARQREPLDQPRLFRFRKSIAARLLAEKESRNAKRLKLSKPALPLIAILEDVLDAHLPKLNGRRN